jgi:molybdopterin-guanine dinucleotide biosynthesis protein A
MKRRSSSSIEICILAGGLSQRMGCDKSRLRLGRRTLLGYICAEAKELDLPVRVIRRDVVPRCGPLGGVYTALKSARTEAVMFLACDMPFITATLLRAVHRRFEDRYEALFVCLGRKPGFPFVLRRGALATVTRQIEQEEFSLRDLARVLNAKTLIMQRWRPQLRNINTPEEWRDARRSLRRA